MDELQFKPIARKLLNHFGFEVFDIDETGNDESPDFEVVGNNDRYTIELKIKGDDQAEIEEEFKALKKGKLVAKSIPIGPRNRLAGIIRKGVSQIVEHDPNKKTFHVIWLHSAGNDPKLHNQRFHATLFGTETLFSIRVDHTFTCYYFHNSAFYSWRNYLDGALLTYANTAQLCINSYSPYAEKFRRSDLTLSLSNGLCDPDKLERENEGVMIADCDINRRNEKEVVRYLQKKYYFDHLQTIPMQQHSGKIAIPDNES